MSRHVSMSQLHAVENDGITPQLFGLLAKERKGTTDMQSAPVVIPPTLVFERGFVKAMYTTEVSRVDGDRLIPMEAEDLPKQSLNMNTATAAGFRLEVKKKLGRDVIIKEVYDEFVQDAKGDGDIVAMLMLCQYADRDDYSGFRYLDKQGLYKFLMQTVDRPRAMLQKFVPPKGRNNTLVFAVWSPLVLVAEGRRAVHALHETVHSTDDRGVTFESDDVRLVRDLALPHTVIDEITTTCLAIKEHVEQAERGLTLTRLACYFKIDCYSTLHLIAATSIRLQKVSKPEIRHPLDLTCGAGSPLRDRVKEQSRIDAELERCQLQQDALQSELSKCLPKGSCIGTVVEEGRRMVATDGSGDGGSSQHRRRSPSLLWDELSSNAGGGTRRAPSVQSAASRANAQPRSSLVLPNGDEYPPRQGGGGGVLSPSPAGGRTPSWQRHRAHMAASPDGAASAPSDPVAALGRRTAMNKILANIHRRAGAARPASTDAVRSVVRDQMRGAALTATERQKRQTAWAPGSGVLAGGSAVLAAQQKDAAALEAEENARLQRAIDRQLARSEGRRGGGGGGVTLVAPEDAILPRPASGSGSSSSLPPKASTPQPKVHQQQQQQQSVVAVVPSGGKLPPPSAAAAIAAASAGAVRTPSPVRQRTTAGVGASAAPPVAATPTPKPARAASGSSASRPSTGSGGGGGTYRYPGGVSSPLSNSRDPPAYIGGTVEPGMVLDALSSVPRSSNAPPFSSTFTRRIAAEERVSRSWHSFLSKQRRELNNIVAASPVQLASPSGGGGGGSGSGHALHSEPFDNTLGALSNSSFSNVFSYMQRRTEPPPAGDMSVDFDAVLKRSMRHKHAADTHAAAGGGTGTGGGVAGGSPAALDASNGLYSRSLRAAQHAYMSPARTANQVLGRQRLQSGVFGSGGGSFGGARSRSNTVTPSHGGGADGDLDAGQLPDGPAPSALMRTRHDTTATPANRQGWGSMGGGDDDHDNAAAEEDEPPLDVPQLIDEAQLPTLPERKGQPASSVALPAGSVVPPTVVLPGMFAASPATKDDGAAGKKRAVGAASSSGSAAANNKASMLGGGPANSKEAQLVLDGDVVVHEATEKVWYLRSAHPEVSEAEMRRLQQHAGTAQVDNVASFFRFVRHVIHRVRSLCRSALAAVAAAAASSSAVDSSSSSLSNGIVYFELPMEFSRASITLDDVSAMFQPLKCTVCSRKAALQQILAQHGGDSSAGQQQQLAWREMMQLRIQALAAIDADHYTRMFEFPLTENPATADFFSKEGTCLSIQVPHHLFAAEDPAAASAERKRKGALAEQQRQELIDVLADSDAAADAACGLDYLLNMDTGAVAYVCLKALPIKEKRAVVM